MMWKPSDNLRAYLLIALTFVIAIWYLQYLWNRRRVYATSLKLPGPFALPFIGSALYFSGNPYDIFGTLTKMFTRYPPVFRVWFGPRMFYVISDPKCHEILLSSQHVLKKEKLYRMTEPVIGHGLLSAPSVKDWKRHRKMIMPAFKQKVLDQFMGVFVDQSEIFCNILRQHTGSDQIDLFNLVSKCTLDIICETAMGVQIEAQTSETKFPKLLDRAAEIAMMRIFNILYHSDFIFYNTSLGRDFANVAKQLRSFTKKVIHEKRIIKNNNNGEYQEAEDILNKKSILKRAALLDLLMDLNCDSKHQFSDEELLDETMTFIIAGTDTTAATNCFALTMLGLHQDMQEVVLTEILDIIGPEARVELSHLPKLIYLERFIKETLRLFPIGSFILRIAEKDLDIGHCVVHKGCSVLFAILGTHRNEKYWPDPCKFDPDRFLPEAVAQRPPGAFIPFSYGPRNCIGPKYGMMAMKTFLATVLRKYRVYTSYRSVKEIELKSNLVLRPKDGFKVRLEHREI